MAFRSNPRPKFMGPSPWLQGAPPTALLPNPMQGQGPMMNQQGSRQGMGFNPIATQLALANNLLTTALGKNQSGFGGRGGGRGILGSAPSFPSGGPGMMRNMMMQGGPPPKRMRMGPGNQVVPPFNQRPRMPFNAANRPQNRTNNNRDQPQPFNRDRIQLRPAVKRTRWEDEKNKKLKETTNDKAKEEKLASEPKKDTEEITVSSGDEKTYDPSSPTSDVELKDEAESSDTKEADAQGILQVTIQKGMKGRSVSKEGEALEEWEKEHGNDETCDWEDAEEQGDDGVAQKEGKATKADSPEKVAKTKKAVTSQSSPVSSAKKNVPPTTPSDIDEKISQESSQVSADVEEDEVVEDPGNIPPYNPDDPAVTGRNSVVPLSGLFCKLCRKFYKDEDSAVKHCQSKPHYDNYKTHLKEKIAANSRKLKEKTELETSPASKPKLQTSPASKPKLEPSPISKPKSILKNPLNKTVLKTDSDVDTLNKDNSAASDDVVPIVQVTELAKIKEEGAKNVSELSVEKNADVDSEQVDKCNEPADSVPEKVSSSPSKDSKPKTPPAKKTPQRGRGRGRK